MRENKFPSSAVKGVFMIYCVNTKGYIVYNLEDEKIMVSRNVKFHEQIFPYVEE